MKRQIFIIIFVLHSVSSLTLEIPNGKIKGTYTRTESGKRMMAFYRIPYAMPPVGELRFLAPQPVENWKGTRNSTQRGAKCFQPKRFPEIPSSENCLHVNVFTKKLDEQQPVIVYIHGGGFETGYGLNTPTQVLMERNIVFVTFNYRLGPFGFLTMGTKEVPGNAGMKDQVMALKWVQENIQYFGGNKNLVTILGFSAGAYSVTSHLASPMSKNLFHRAIAMSGSITTTSKLRKHYPEALEKLQKSFKCSNENVLKCLQNVSAEEISSIPFKSFDCEFVPWLPVIEDDFGQERFLIENPLKTLQSGRFNRVPVVAGRSDSELKDHEGLISPSLLTDFNKNFTAVAQKCFFFWENQEQSNFMSQVLWEKFLKNSSKITKVLKNELNSLSSDAFFGYPVHKLVESISSFTDTYYYSIKGAYHKTSIFSTETKTRAFFTKLLEDFALKGNPNNPQWTKYTPSNRVYIEICDEPKLKSNLDWNRYKIWDEISSSQESIETNTCSLMNSREILRVFIVSAFLTVLIVILRYFCLWSSSRINQYRFLENSLPMKSKK